MIGNMRNRLEEFKDSPSRMKEYDLQGSQRRLNSRESIQVDDYYENINTQVRFEIK